MIDRIYEQLRTRSAATGEIRAADLRGGARLAVRVRGRTTTVAVWRRAKRIGATELVTFERLIQPPCGSRLHDEQITKPGDDGGLWYVVAWRWGNDDER